MNKQRRQRLAEADALLKKAYAATADAKASLKQAYVIVDTALDQEQDCLDNMPENLQYSDRYEKMEAAVDNLENALSHIEDAENSIDEATA